MDDLKYLAGFLVPVNGKIPNINDLVKETPAMPESKPFTKSDLKDGMRVTDEYGNELLFMEGGLYDFQHQNELFVRQCGLNGYTSYLLGNSASPDIIKVTDRDGTVLFEREPEKRKVTLDLTEEQEAQIRKQLEE